MSHVKAYARKTKSGKTVMVKEHDDKRHAEIKKLMTEKLHAAEKYLADMKKPGMANDEHIAVAQKRVDDQKAVIKKHNAKQGSGHPKSFDVRYGIGRVKYLLSHHDGVDTHSDGSPFYGASTFKNKKTLEAKIKELREAGYEGQY